MMNENEDDIVADDIVTRLRSAARSGDLPLGVAFNCDAVADEIERLEQYVEELRSDRYEWVKKAQGQEAEIERLRDELDAGRALADQLAVALAAQGSASFDEDTNLNIKRLALDAFKEARRG